MTTALITVETGLLVVLVVLVAGLLRSHAEILRRLGPASEADGLPAPPRAARRAGTAAPALTGRTPEGDAVALSLQNGAPTLLAFLTSGCSSCLHFWETLAEPRLPSDVRTVIVTRGTDRESPVKLLELAPAEVPVVMSSEAWEAYGVPGSPYFVLVQGDIRGEGVATTWDALASLVTDAIHEQRRSIDETFASAGIGPGHSSLYPGGRA